jgi:Rrf2 family nitric oxide-sensitive transcriptional repressor
MEDDLNLVECFCDGGQCIITPVCELRNVLNQSLDAYIATLKKYTLADLLEPRDKLSKILGLPGKAA